ncbi:hypothetical protein BG011_005592 [Mortierella polycephala]|uniref:Arrestin C-terminal-like domain-containing protein n=1 Tax=Mortierella polycephala TaxID=41804 RepID=A0A9P6QCU2_9FUNG|nr:hypothetical protein BG011_005592 [Mortierella polycephala]
MRFFSKSHVNSIANIIPPKGFTVSLRTINGQNQCYGPGTVIQGQINLSLNKIITMPCQLRVIFTCCQTITKESENEDGSPPSILFQVEHVLLQDQALPPCRRQTPFHFSIKLPLCNFPPSLEGECSVQYSIRSTLSFAPSPEDPSSTPSISSLPIRILYLPLVPTTALQTRFLCSSTSASSYENSAQLILDTPRPIQILSRPSVPTTQSLSQSVISASIKSMTSACIGESILMVLKVDNATQTELHSIRLTLIRQVSYAAPASPSSPPSSPSLAAVDGHHQHEHQAPYSYTTPDSTIIHSTTIPIAKVPNINSSWSQQLQFRLPTHKGLIPSINKAITPLLKVDYFILISIPIPQKHSSLVDRLTLGKQKRPAMDMSIFDDSSMTQPVLQGPLQQPQQTLGRLSASAFGATRGLNMFQLALIPIVIGSIPSYVGHQRFKWPIPSHVEVTDRPTFIRDRFEEEMIQHLSSLESLITEDENDMDIENLILAARKNRPLSSGESDDGGDEGDHEDDGHVHSQLPARFRRGGRLGYRSNSLLSSGLRTPPLSPQNAPLATMDDVVRIRPLVESNDVGLS